MVGFDVEFLCDRRAGADLCEDMRRYGGAVVGPCFVCRGEGGAEVECVDGAVVRDLFFAKELWHACTIASIYRESGIPKNGLEG